MRFKTKLDQRVLESRPEPNPRSRSTQSTFEGSAGVGWRVPFRGDNHNKLIPRDGRPGELLAMKGSFHEAQFRAAVLDGRSDLRRIPDLEVYVDQRIGSTKRYQMPG